jgi:hypothetical protein
MTLRKREHAAIWKGKHKVTLSWEVALKEVTDLSQDRLCSKWIIDLEGVLCTRTFPHVINYSPPQPHELHSFGTFQNLNKPLTVTLTITVSSFPAIHKFNFYFVWQTLSVCKYCSIYCMAIASKWYIISFQIWIERSFPPTHKYKEMRNE